VGRVAVTARRRGHRPGIPAAEREQIFNASIARAKHRMARASAWRSRCDLSSTNGTGRRRQRQAVLEWRLVARISDRAFDLQAMSSRPTSALGHEVLEARRS